LNRSFLITFCGSTIFPESDDFCHEFSLRNEDGEELSDALGIVFIEFTKLEDIRQKPIIEMSAAEIWSFFFAYGDERQYPRLLDALKYTKKEIRLAGRLLNTISSDLLDNRIIIVLGRNTRWIWGIILPSRWKR
jgi:hypothetical protein